MKTITHIPIQYRKDNLDILGEGCKSCEYRERCKTGSCGITEYTKYEGTTDLMNYYLHYSTNLKQETVVKKYRYGYLLITKGEKFISGEIDDRWRVLFFNKDRKRDSHILGFCEEVIRNGKRYLDVSKDSAKFYGIKRYQRLISDNGIMMY